MSLSRYPGAQPFERSHQDVFFGREEDLDRLRRKVKLAPLTVLHGKSGLGKSSLLNAGLLPLLEAEGHYQAVRVRFNAWQAERQDADPAAKSIAAVAALGEGPTFLRKLVPEEHSLWRYAKEHAIRTGGERGLLLVFDQFEELFTYPAEAILAFRRQLAEALYTPAPQRYWDELEERFEQEDEPLSREELSLFQQPPDIRVVLAIRSDRFHLLDNLSDYLPKVLNNCLELTPLGRRQARAAIEEPAFASGDFASPRFTYGAEALDLIMDFLTQNGEEPVDTTQLQIICHHLERKLAQSQALEVLPEDVGDLPAVIERYYDERIQLISDPDQQLAARRLIEEGLIFEEEERRLSLYEGQALRSFGLRHETLRTLVDSHLLRAEPSLRGGYTYELSHDTLVAPILKAKGLRLAAERKEAEARQRVERERERQLERRKRRRAYALAIAGLTLAAIALGAAFVAYRQTRALRQAKEEIAKSAYDLQLGSALANKVQGRYELAIDQLERTIPFAEAASPTAEADIAALLQDWRSVRGIMARADSFASERRYRLAMERYEEAQTISPDEYIAGRRAQAANDLEEEYQRLLRAGDSMANAGELERARDHFQRALELKPGDALATAKLQQLAE